jgi:hypothetical protein
MSTAVDTFLVVAAAAALFVAAGVVLYARGRFGALNARMFALQIRKLLDAGNRERAIKLCQAAEQSTAIYRLTLFLLGQQIPTTTLLDDAAGGYRDSVPARDFADLLRERVAEELLARRRPLVRRAVVNASLFVVAVVIAVPLRLWGRPITPLSLQLVPAVLGTAVVAALGAALVLRSLRKDLRGLAQIVEETLPALCPVEQMSEGDRKAAERAVQLLSGAAGKGLPLPVPDARPGVCPRCGRENSPNLRFCLGCGEELRLVEEAGEAERELPEAPNRPARRAKFCAFCGTELSPDARWCPYCGKKLPT